MTPEKFIKLCAHSSLRLVRPAAEDLGDTAVTCVDSNGFTALHASLGGDSQVTLFLIQHSADVNYVRPGGYHPLFNDYKSIYRYRKNLLLFLTHGFDPNVVNQKGETLLHIFTRRGYVSLCRIVFKYSTVPVRTDIPDKMSETVADIISAGDVPDLVRLLSKNTKAELPPETTEIPTEIMSPPRAAGTGS